MRCAQPLNIEELIDPAGGEAECFFLQLLSTVAFLFCVMACAEDIASPSSCFTGLDIRVAVSGGFDRSVAQSGLREDGILAIEDVTRSSPTAVGGEVIVLAVEDDLSCFTDPMHDRSPPRSS